MLLHTIENLDVDEDQNGTAKRGIATAITRLKDSEAKSKIIILITDGRNNAERLTNDCCRTRKDTCIKVYCVAGGTGPVDFPFASNFLVYSIVK